MSIEKMTTMEQVETRANLYRLATEAFESEGFATQPIKGGRLIGLGNGHFDLGNIELHGDIRGDIADHGLATVRERDNIYFLDIHPATQNPTAVPVISKGFPHFDTFPDCR